MLFLQGMQNVTLLDYPGQVACTIFTEGCNFRCPFCHNKKLLHYPQETSLSQEDVLTYLRKRYGLLDAVCISGGEPLLQDGLETFLQEIKAIGYLIKLDTNGSFPDRLKMLVQKQLVDYIAMDIKNSLDRYAETSGITNLYLDAVVQSAAFLLEGKIPYEFRTTVVREFHTIESFQKIARWIAGAERYYLQSFVNAKSVLRNDLHAYTITELKEFRKILLPWIPSIQIRGVEIP